MIGEILAPAGNYEKLKTAVNFGADAVYLSGKKFGMRAFAGNFDLDEIYSASKFCKERGVSSFLTLNIMAHNKDLEDLPTYLNEIKESDIDALIVADLGVMEIVKKHIENKEIHISTQFSATNYKTYELLKDLGASRVVLPRELTFDEIKQIREFTDLDLEMFVHGAMCMSYSGRCMISYHTSNRDPNKGECSQPCRYPYKLSTNFLDDPIIAEEDERGTYFFNSKDLSLLKRIPQLMDIGINSFKIEGRMKAISYLSSVIHLYKDVRDTYKKDPKGFVYKPEWDENLSKIANRGYTEFYFEGKTTPERSQAVDRSKEISNYDIAGVVKEIIDRTFMVVEVKSAFHPNDEMEIVIPEKRILTIRPPFIKDVVGRELERTKPNQIVVMRHHKSVVPGSIIRVKKNG
ncbi:MAG: peptidase U32 [Candidatus Cloacimonadota bacterium]|nr:MAG: peptidase U32 [Candidatus Cloacimonadota bacterium]PIE78295.1 MAG: peptidase U32 [Candidatus Delongbacteria bacterium]